MRARHRIVIIGVVWMAAAPTARAAAQSSSATISATVSPFAKLTLSSASLSFPDADPDAIPQIPAIGAPLLVTAKSRATPSAQVVLTAQASDDLRSGVTVIAASNVTWTATGAGFSNGALRAASPVTVGTWTGSGVRSGSLQFYFRNLWTHPTGTYTLSMVFTLSAP